MTLEILFLARALLAQGSPPPNQLTLEEQKAGWRLLFDGKTTGGWRGFKKTDFPADKWAVRDGCLAKTATGTGDSHGGGDIVTLDTFSDFDLRFEWRIAPGANSGVKYFVTEERADPIAHEYQVLDDGRHPDARVGPRRQTAAFYDVLPSAADKPLRPVGEWNRSKVIFRGNHGEHWLNGEKIVEFDLGTARMDSALAASKYHSIQGFAERRRGHIVLQDHGDEVYFRNIKIREL